MATAKKNKESSHFDSVCCALQGGGALGAYQVGVLKSLFEGGYDPNWFVGTSIGAVNAAISAGNPPEERIAQLEKFWKIISRDSYIKHSHFVEDYHSKKFLHYLSSQATMMFGQPGFFIPRFPPPNLGWHKEPTKISYYDTSPLKSTLESLIDFDRINSGKIRLSLGAVEIASGEMHYFDSLKQKIVVEHIMASAALPPGFPAVEVEGKLYWDGGISSNSPISYVLCDNHFKKLLCFMVHLFDSYGLVPTSLDEILKRKKDIEFSSRFYKFINLYKEIHTLKYKIHRMSQHMSKTDKSIEAVEDCLEEGWHKQVALVRFLLKGDETDLSSKDYEFSRHSVEDRIHFGYKDGQKGIKNRTWDKAALQKDGIVLFDLSVTSDQKD